MRDDEPERSEGTRCTGVDCTTARCPVLPAPVTGVPSLRSGSSQSAGRCSSALSAHRRGVHASVPIIGYPSDMNSEHARDALLAQVASAPDLDAALASVIGALAADSGTLHLIGDDGQLHLVAASAGIPEPVRRIVAVVPIGKGMAGLAAERNAPVTACNIQTDTTGDVRPGAKATGMEGAIVVPMRRDGRVVGTLGVANRAERTFSEAEEASLIDAAAAMARRVDATSRA